MKNIFKNFFDLRSLEKELVNTWIFSPFQLRSSGPSYYNRRTKCVLLIGLLAARLADDDHFYINPSLLPVSDGQIVELAEGRAARWTPEALYAEIGVDPNTFLEQKKFLLTKESYPKFMDAMTAIRDLLQYYTTQIWVAEEGTYKYRITKIR